jgi:general stress protein YciG/DNA-binding CsgD family transcriptional regulator
MPPPSQRTKRQGAPEEILLLAGAPCLGPSELERLAATLVGLPLTDVQGQTQHVVAVRLDVQARKVYGQIQALTEAAPALFASAPGDATEPPPWTDPGEMHPPRRGQTTVGEAGRKGGSKVKEKYGTGFYGEIGKKGGQAVKDQHDPNYYVALGRQGGQTLSRKRGPEYFAQIGKKGGTALKAQRGPEYYRAIGQRGGRAPRRPNLSREEALRAAFEHLSHDEPPATPAKLAALCGLSLSSVYSVLKRASWWGPAEQQAARALHYQRLHALASEQGYPGIQAMRQHPSTSRRRLTLEEVQEIRRHLAQGHSPSAIARHLGIHKNTVYSLKQGRTLRIERQADEHGPTEEEQQLQVVWDEATAEVQVCISRTLWRALGAPPSLLLSRQGKWHAVMLEPARGEQGYPVEAQGPVSCIRIERQAFQSLGLPQGKYAAVRVPHQAQVRISDYPVGLTDEMVTLSEARKQLGISRQRLSQLIDSGKLRAWFDAKRHQFVVSRLAVAARREQRAGGEAAPSANEGQET